jgi:hypothetical protein
MPELKDILNNQEPKKSTPTDSLSLDNVITNKLNTEDPRKAVQLGQHGVGQSKFDVGVTPENVSQLQDIRGNRQPIIDKAFNGVLQASGKAVGSFVNGTAGTIYGVGAALSTVGSKEGFQFSKLYNNEVTQAVDKANASISKGQPLYTTKEYDQMPWYEKLTKANLWWGDILSGAGYTLGAVGTGAGTSAIYRGLAKQLGGVGKIAKAGEQLATATTSAMGEAGDEGRQGTNDFIQKTLADRKAYYESIGQEIPKEEVDKITTMGHELGNTIFLTNLPIIAGSNFLQFGKVMTNMKAEKASIGEIAKEVSGKIEQKKALGEFSKVELSPLEQKIGKATKVLTQPVEEGTQEQLQNAIQTASGDFYSKKFKGEDTNILESTLLGLKEAYGTNKGWESFVVGALSTLISGGAAKGSALRDAFKSDDPSIKTALEVLNKYKPQEVYKQLIQADNRAKVISGQMSDAAAKDDKFEFNNAQNDLLTSYVLSRLKTDQFDNLQEDLDAMKNMQPEEFQKTFGVSPEETNKSSVLQYVQDRINKADNIKEAYETIEFRYKDFSEGNKERLIHAAITIDDTKTRRKKLMQDMMNLTVKEGSDLLVTLNDQIYQNLPGDNKYKPLTDTEDFKKALDKVNPIRKPEILALVGDLDKLNKREEEYSKLYTDIISNEKLRKDLEAEDKTNEEKEVITKEIPPVDETITPEQQSQEFRPNSIVQLRGSGKSQVVESIDEDGIVHLKDDPNVYDKSEFYIPKIQPNVGKETIFKDRDITLPYTGDRKDEGGIHESGTTERVQTVLNSITSQEELLKRSRVKLTRTISVEGNKERGNKHFLGANPKETKVTITPNTTLDVVYELQDNNGEWFDAFHGPHSDQYTTVEPDGSSKPFHFNEETKSQVNQIFDTKDKKADLGTPLTNNEINTLIEQQKKLDATNTIFQSIYTTQGEITIPAIELKNNYGITIFSKKGKFDTLPTDQGKPSLTKITKANIDGNYYIYDALNISNVDQLKLVGNLENLSESERLLSTVKNPNNFISELTSRYIALGQEPSGETFLFSVDTPIFTNDQLSPILNDIFSRDSISKDDVKKINDSLAEKIHIISPKGTRLELKIDTTKDNQFSKFQIVESKDNKKIYHDIAGSKVSTVNSIIKGANKSGLKLSDDSFRQSIPNTPETRSLKGEELANKFTSNVSSNVFKYSKISIDINLPKITTTTTIKPTNVSKQPSQVKVDSKTTKTRIQELEDIINTSTNIDQVVDAAAELNALQREESSNKTITKDIDEVGETPLNKLSPTQAQVLIDIPEATKWLKDNLPVSDVLVFEDVNTLLKNTENKGFTWGFTVGKVIALNKAAEKGTEFHEAFHFTFRNLLSNSEITKLYQIAKSKYGEPTNSEIKELKNQSSTNKKLVPSQLKELWYEERMADSFASWKAGKSKAENLGLIGKIFRKIQELITFFINKPTKLEALFGKINSGSFKNSDVNIYNRFTNYNNPVFKQIPNGTKDSEETGKTKYTYSGLEEGRQIIRTLTAKVVKAKQTTSTEDVNGIIDALITKEFEFNDPKNNTALIASIPSTDRLNVIKKLANNQFIYSNPESISIIKDQIEKLLDVFNFTPEESDLDEQLNEIENERALLDFDKNAINIGGIGSLNKEVRAYIGTTLYNTTDLLGRDIQVAVDPQVVYQGIQRNLTSTNPGSMMAKLKVYADYNPQTKAVYDRIVEDSGYDETTGVVKLNPQLLTKFTNSFTTEYLNYLQILPNPETGVYKIINANQKDAKYIQFSEWLRNFNNSSQQYSDSNITKLTKASELIVSGDVSKANSIKIALHGIGIEVSEAYIKFSILKNSNSTDPLVTLNPDSKALTEEDLSQIIATLRKKENPFEGEDETKGNVGRLLSIADNNAQFDETVLSSNYQDSEGKTRYSYVQPALALEKTRELESVLSTPEGRESFKEDLKQQYTHNYGFNDGNYLLNHPLADNLFSKFRLEFTGDIRQDQKGKEGSSFKHIDSRSFKLMQYGLFSKQTKRGDLTVGKFYAKVLEAKSSAYSIELPIEDFSTAKGEPNAKALDALYKQFMQEIERINITQKEIENPNVVKVKDYHQGKLRGLELFYFKFLETSPLGEEILKRAKYNSSLASFHDLEDQIKDEIRVFVTREIDQERQTLKDLGVLSKDQNLLPFNLKNNPQESIANFYLNSLVNLNAYNDLIELNAAFSKNSVDNIKRSGRWVAAKINFGKGSHIVGFIAEPQAQGLTKTIDIADAQAYIDINHAKFILNREGKLSAEINRIYDKINDGEQLTWDEINHLKATGTMLNSIKTVTSGPVDYHKMSDMILTKKLTSEKNNKGEWVAQKGKEYLHNIRIQLENLSRRSTIRQNSGFNWIDNLSVEQIDQIVPARILPESASKLLTYKGAELVDNNYTFTKDNTRLVDNKYSGRQVETPSGKTEIVYGTQLIQLIDSEQDDNTSVTFLGKKVTLGELRKIYQNLLSQARTNSVDQAKKFLGKLVNGQLSEKEETKFRKKLSSTLEESGADDSLLQFFGVDPMYNLNLPNTLNKYEQLFLAHFTKGVLSQKTAGLKLTLVSGHGYNVKDEKTGEYRELKYIPGGLSEVTLPAFTKELHELKPGDILSAKQVLEMFGQRIPTQDKHSMIAFKVVEFLPSEYGSIGIFPKEVIELSGADFDIDSIFVERKDYYGQFIPYGTMSTIVGKYNEFVQYNKHYNKDFKKLLKVNGDNIEQALKDLQLPSNIEEFKKETKDGTIELNNGVINNQLVDANIAFLTNDKMVEKGIPQTPATTKRLSDVRDDIFALLNKDPNAQFTINSPVGQFTAWKNNSTGKENVGPAANMNLARAFLYKAKVHLQKNTFRSIFNGDKFFDFSKNKDSQDKRIQDTLSTILSAMTDNAKDPIAGDLNLSLTSLGPALQLVSLGVDLKDVMLLINSPLVKEYTQAKEAAKTVVKPSRETVTPKIDKKKYILNAKEKAESALKDVLRWSNDPDKVSKYFQDTYIHPYSDGKFNLSTEDLAWSIENNQYIKEPETNQEVLDRQDAMDRARHYYIQYAALLNFLELEEQGKYWQALSKLLALNKGLPSTFKDTQAIWDAIELFKLDSKEALPKEAPFDIKNALEGTHVENNIKLFKDIMGMSKHYFITQSEMFSQVINHIDESLKDNIYNRAKVINDIKLDFLSYITIQAYNKRIGKDLRQNLLIGDNTIIDQKNALLKENPELKNNKLIRFLDVDKSSGLSTLVANTRIKLSSSQIEELTDSFRELFNNEVSNQFARNLFDYLIVKDNLQFVNNSFIKFISPFMFIEVSKTLDNINDKLINGGKSTELFGQTVGELSNNFKDIWFRHIDNQQYIQVLESKEALKADVKPDYIRLGTLSNGSLLKLNEAKDFYNKITTIGNEVQHPYGFKTAEEVEKNSNLIQPISKATEDLISDVDDNISEINERQYQKKSSDKENNTSAANIDRKNIPIKVNETIEKQIGRELTIKDNNGKYYIEKRGDHYEILKNWMDKGIIISRAVSDKYPGAIERRGNKIFINNQTKLALNADKTVSKSSTDVINDFISNNTTSTSILNKIIEKMKSSDSKKLAEFLLSMQDKNKTLKVSVEDKFTPEMIKAAKLKVKEGVVVNAFFNADTNTIHISKEIMNNNDENHFMRVFLHEVIHSYTMFPFIKKGNLTKAEQTFVSRIAELYAQAKKDNPQSDLYGYTNEVEFISEIMTSSKFANAVKKENLPLWKRIVNLISRFLTNNEIFDSKNIEEEARKVIYDYIDNLNKVDLRGNLAYESRPSLEEKDQSIERPFETQEVALKREITRLQKLLNIIPKGTNKYGETEEKLKSLEDNLAIAIKSQEQPDFLKLGEQVLLSVKIEIGKLESGRLEDVDSRLDDVLDLLDVWSEFTGLRDETAKLIARLYPFLSKDLVDKVNNYATERNEDGSKKKFTIDDIYSQTEDVNSFTGGVGALADSKNLIARTIGSKIKEGQNTASTKNKKLTDEVQEHVDELSTWAKNNGIKQADVYEIFIQEHNGSTSLVMEFNQDFYSDLKEAFTNLKSSNKIKKEESKVWIRDNATQTTEGWKALKSSYSNENYRKIQSTPELKAFYDFYQETIIKAEEKLPVKVGKNFIANIHKETTFGKLANLFKTSVGDQFIADEDLILDIIDIQFKSKIASKDKSRDLGASLLQFAAFANNHNEMSTILPEIRNLQRHLEYKYNAKGDKIVRKFIKSSEPGKKISGKNTNLYEMVKTIVEMQVKGKTKKIQGRVVYSKTYDENGELTEKAVNVSDLVDIGLKFNSILRIGFSPITAIANWMFGDISNIMEAIGGRFFGLKELQQATNMFYAQAYTKDSVLFKLNEELNFLQELDDYNRVDKIKLKGKFTTEQLQEGMYAPQKRGEFFLQTRVGMAVLIKEGYIKDQQLTDKWNNASAKEKEELTDKIQRLNQKIHGRYTTRESAALSQGALYRLASQFRKWIPAALEDRFGENKWDNRLQVQIEGRYITIKNLAAELITNGGKLANGRELTELELYNLKKTASELIMWIGISVLYAFVHGGDDDKERRKKMWAKTILTLLNRASGDLSYFYNPKSGTQLAKNAIPLAKTLEDIITAGAYLPYAFGIEGSTYKSGSHKGHNKLAVKLANITPGIKPIADVVRLAESNQLEELK